MDVQEFFDHGADHYLPNLSIDIVMIGYQEQELKCLLLQIGNKWLLPGGYVQVNESVDKAAIRILKERTNLDDPHLKFLSVFGDKNRKFLDEWKQFVNMVGIPWKDEYWVNSRFVTLAYYALVDITRVHPVKAEMNSDIGWFSFNELPEIWMDHKAIIEEARNKLKEDIKHEHVTFNLLPDPFTMPELHQLHQAILEELIDRSRFQKKMLASGKFERLPKIQTESPGRNPYQYRMIDTE